jgi:hypothetical protein
VTIFWGEESEDRLSDAHEDIKATAEDLMDDAERLKQIEAQKLALRPGDPQLVILAEEARSIIAGMKPKGEIQRQLAADAEGG